MGKNDQIEGQMSLFDFLEAPSAAVEAPKEQQLRKNIPWPCRECKWYDGCCCEYDKKPEQYGECNLFVSRTPNFDTMSIEEAVKMVEEGTGLKFKPTDWSPNGEQEYEAKVGKSKVSIHFSHYAEGIHGARRHLGLSIQHSTGGFGSPCDSIEEVIEQINKRQRRADQEKKRIDESFRPKDEEAYGERVDKPVCKHSEHTCNKEELWKVAEDIGEDCPKSCCRACSNENCGARCNGAPKDKPIEKYGVTWQPISIKPTQDKPMEILGCYKYNNKENWSCCPAALIDGDIVARDVPIDIPTPEWKYWRYKEQTKACADCINWFEEGCIINNNFSRYHKYDADWASLPKCEHKSRFYPKSMSRCENKENCDDYPIHCKGECFWCHRNPNLSGDNCLNCRKYKIECFPEHATVHGKCEKYKVIPDFYRVMRCQLCKYWSCSTEQPPAGWGIDGFCSLARNKTQAHSGCTYFEREGDTNGDREIQTDRSELLHTAEEEI